MGGLTAAAYQRRIFTGFPWPRDPAKAGFYAVVDVTPLIPLLNDLKIQQLHGNTRLPKVYPHFALLLAGLRVAGHTRLTRRSEMAPRVALLASRAKWGQVASGPVAK